jgi:transposase
MAAPRRVIALVSDAAQRQQLQEIARSRTEPASRVERARIILGYLAQPSAYAVARAVGVTAQTVSRCLDRAAELGVIEALDDRQRTGRDPTITAEARTWLVALACQKPKALGYSHELWTTRLLAAHARDRGPAAGHPSVAKLAQGTVCKILAITRSSRTRCAITWRSAIRNSSQDGGNPVHLSPSRGVARAGTSRSAARLSRRR